MNEIYAIDEIDFETNLRQEDVIKIAEQYVKMKNAPYDINREHIFYDAQSHVIDGEVWYINVITLAVKEKWPDAYDTLAISDRQGKLAYIMNDHGVVVEKF